MRSLLPALLAITAVIAACGDVAPSPTPMAPAPFVAAASACIRSAPAVHLTGTTTVAGEHATFDVNVDSGGDAAGTTSVGTAGGDLIVSGRSAYMRGAGLWRLQAGARAAAAIGDRWVRAAKDDAAADFPLAGGALLDLAGLANNIDSFTDADGVTAGRTPQGADAWIIHGKDADLYVATAAGGCPLYIVSDADATVHTAFAVLPAAVAVTAPANAIEFTSIEPLLATPGGPTPG